MTKALTAMIDLQALEARAYERVERSAVHGLVAVKEISVAVQADDAARLHRKYRRAGVSAERRAVVEYRLRAAARDFVRGCTLDAERPLKERADEEWVSLRVVEGIADGDNGMACLDGRGVQLKRLSR